MGRNILALDTSTSACSVACWISNKVVAEDYVDLGRGHAEALVPMIASVMREASIDYSQLDAVAVTLGPGTFTGLRIGFSAARGLALAISKPMVGVTSLEAIAHATRFSQRSVLAILDARRGQFYAQSFNSELQPVTSPSVVQAANIQSLVPASPFVVVGTGAVIARPFLMRFSFSREDVIFDSSVGSPQATVVAKIASVRKPVESRFLKPLYLRSPDVTFPKE